MAFRGPFLAPLLVVACTSKSDADPDPAPTKSAESAAAPSSEAPVAVGEASTPEPSAAPAGDVWLVWTADEAGEFRTRWLQEAGESATVVATQDLLVVSDGTTLWRIDAGEVSVGVFPCECEDVAEMRPDDVDCTTPEEANVLPTLTAVNLLDGTSIPIVDAGDFSVEDGRVQGFDHEFDAAIVGGNDARLLLSISESGYFCGAHGMAQTRFEVFDLATGKPIDDALDEVAPHLPPATRKEAAAEALVEVQECEAEDAPSLDELLENGLELQSLSTRLAAGAPSIAWHFEVFLPYVCAHDYAAHGSATTDLIEAAAPIGLGPSLSPAALAAMKPLGDAGAVGWSKLTTDLAARDAALSKFRTAAASRPAPAKATPKPAAPSPGPAKRTAATVDRRDVLRRARQAVNAKDYPTAIALLDDAIADDPEFARGWSTRGYARLLQGKLDAAKKDLKTALAKHPDDAKFAAAIHFNLGQIAEKNGDLAAAKASYAESARLRDSKQARAALDRLGDGRRSATATGVSSGSSTATASTLDVPVDAYGDVVLVIESRPGRPATSTTAADRRGGTSWSRRAPRRRSTPRSRRPGGCRT